MRCLEMNFYTSGFHKFRYYKNKIYLVSAGENDDECYEIYRLNLNSFESEMIKENNFLKMVVFF